MAVIVSGSSACHHYFVSAQAKGGGLSDLLQSSLERAVKKRAVANLFGEICPQYLCYNDQTCCFSVASLIRHVVSVLLH